MINYSSTTWPTNVPNRAGYVSLIEGSAGIGKTSFALLSCIESGRGCTYISYTEPESSLMSKARKISPDFKGNIKVIRMMTGDPSRVFSTILNAIEKSELVVLDSLDAMFSGINEEREIRSFLELIYNSVKGKSGSLLIISEGTSSASSHIKFVSDAIISMDYAEVLGSRARFLQIIKDRDYPTPLYPFFFTLFNGFKILEPLTGIYPASIKNLLPISRPEEANISYQFSRWHRILTVFEEGISHELEAFYRQWVAADYLMVGKRVNYIISKIENEEEVYSSIYDMLGSKTENLKVISADPSSVGYDPERYIEAMTTGYTGKDVVNIIDALADEEFAVMKPEAYEEFVSHITPKSGLNSLTLIYGSHNLKAVEIQKKYVDIERHMVNRHGHLFWKATKPPGDLYHVSVDYESRTMKFMRMM